MGIVAKVFLWAGHPSCYPNNTVKAPNETQSADSNHWTCLIHFYPSSEKRSIAAFVFLSKTMTAILKDYRVTS